MRILLTITALVLVFSLELSGQNDFKTLDKKTYDYYINGDYRNLKLTGDSMLAKGMDYYYLRMRLGISAYNNQLYSSAVKHFNKALDFSSLDTISREYIYNSYLFSGRKADANLYLKSLTGDTRNVSLKSISSPGFSNVYAGLSAAGYDVILYERNFLNYEAIKSSISINAGLESYFLNRFKGTFAYTNLRKTGTIYSLADTAGKDLNFNQNQLYAKLSFAVFKGWEFSGFGHVAFFSDALPPRANGLSNSILVTEYTAGLGISKNGWKIRTGANVSFSNFGASNQVRGEGFLTWLPKGNLNLYLTSGGMYQHDYSWGNTYQVNAELGFKVVRSLWFEAGFLKGNSFLNARNQGNIINNSFQIPATTVYGNIILFPGKKLNITLSPFYTENHSYSRNLNTYMRTNKLTLNSFGGAIKLTYNRK
jgi:hypothetical protein